MQATLEPRSTSVLAEARRPPALKALTSLRFLAALQVALYHFVRPHQQWGWFAPVNRAGYVGVSFFFLLSGFILCYTHAPEYAGLRAGPVRFWVARFARIYPLYALSLLLSGVLDFHFFNRTAHIAVFAADLLMIQTWSGHLRYLFNPVTWSLSVEAFFYAIFPYTVMRLLPPSRGRAWLHLALMWLLTLLAPLVLMHWYPQAVWHEGSYGDPGRMAVETIKRIPLFLVPEFFAGVLLGWIYLRFRPGRAVLLCLTYAGLLLLGLGLFNSDHLPFAALHNGLLLPCYGLLLLGLTEPSWLSRALSNDLLVLLGESSYALYLMHELLNHFANANGADNSIGAGLLKLLAIIPISIVLHLYVEKPCRRWILGWWKRGHERAAVVPAA